MAGMSETSRAEGGSPPRTKRSDVRTLGAIPGVQMENLVCSRTMVWPHEGPLASWVVSARLHDLTGITLND
jgi:hypothetical protein